MASGETLEMGYPPVADAISPSCNLSETRDFDALPVPPLDDSIFSEDFTLPDNFIPDLGSFDDEDFDFSLDDLYFPSENEDLLAALPGSGQPLGSIAAQITTDHNPILSNCSAPESGVLVSEHSGPEVCPFTADRSINDAVYKSPSPGSCQESGSDAAIFLNDSTPESGGFVCESPQESGSRCSETARVLEFPSSDAEVQRREASGLASSQSSGNCGSDVSETLNYPSPDSGNCVRSAAASPNSANSIGGIVDHKIKLEELGSTYLSKRKKENGDVSADTRTKKFQKADGVETPNPPSGFNAVNDEEEKRKARLMRNRESAQLSRQRKKHYVEELEDKVRAMHSTIQDLNSKISFIMAENASLRQQLSGGAVCPPIPGMYPHPPMAPMGYPWIPRPPYAMKPQGSQVPLVPIPRLKPQQPASAPKAKKVETKKTEGKTKKVASVSFLGLLFFILLFGGLVPVVNVKYGGMRDAAPCNRFYNQQHRGRVLTVGSHLNGTDQNRGIGFSNGGLGKDFNPINHVGGTKPNIEQKGGSHHLPVSDEFVRPRNTSEPLVASLYVPRNDKLVKIDGNLIIHSVLASEKAKTSPKETGLAVPRNLAPAISLSVRNGRHPHLYRSPTEQQRALASGAPANDNLNSKSADGKLQQWFQEGLAGPMLHSGMCTEVFQFDVSPNSSPGAIIPASSVRNISSEHRQNSTRINKGRNRRVLHGLPIPLPGSVNITEEHVGRNSGKDNLHGSKSLSPMVVSVLVDPREAGDNDGDSIRGPKSLSRIFVVVLMDSVKYVTYSCMLPLKGSGLQLVTT